MPFLLFLLSVATLVAVSSKSKAGQPGGRTQTFTLDANMPEPLRNQVIAALVTGTDPATLDAFATAIQAQYPLSAGLLHTKATSLRAGIPAAPPAPSLPATGDPGGPPLDPSMPPSMVAFVHTELARETDPMKLLTLANTIAPQYPLAASLLTQCAAMLNVQPSQPSTPAPVMPSPLPQPSPAPPPSPVPADPPAPALTMPGLDPGMPPDVAQAVMGALISENDPAKLQALEQQLQGHYPLAANLLAQKASTLLALHQAVTPPTVPPSPSPSPIPAPQPIVVPSGMPGLDANMPPETAQLVMSELVNEADPVKLQTLGDELAPQYPVAAGLLRVRANVIFATRPPLQIVPDPSTPTVLARTYTVKDGDFPWKLAERYTTHGARWPELVAANPQKARAKDGNFASLLPGEKLNLPASWVSLSQPAPASVPSPIAPPQPVISPAPVDVALDQNLPADLATAVQNALKSATDPNQLRGFASAIRQRGFPVAADLLTTKANALGAPAPTGIVLANTSPTPSTPSSAPQGTTYRVKAGDSPSKIAAALVHDGNRWKELVAANPLKKRAKDGNFASLMPGELLQLPPSWGANGAPSKPAHVPQGGV